jgi:small GTP-binding protein
MSNSEILNTYEDLGIELQYDHLYKIIIIGDTSVGKTALLSKYLKGVFPTSPLSTVATEFATKIIQIKEGGYIKAQIWDTAGQENKEKEQTNDDSEKEKNDEISKDFEILSSDSAQYDYNYKIIIIGDSGVGKTCLTYRATSGEFREKMAATIGFEYFPFVVKYKNKILKLEIWDTCGQEAYRSLIKSFFNNSSLAIIVYAVDNKKSFSSIDEWIRQCRSLCSPDTRFFLIGNKNDVEEEK